MNRASHWTASIKIAFFETLSYVLLNSPLEDKSDLARTSSSYNSELAYLAITIQQGAHLLCNDKHTSWTDHGNAVSDRYIVTL